MGDKHQKLGFEKRLFLWAALAGLPAFTAAALLAWFGPLPNAAAWVTAGLLACFWLGGAWLLVGKVRFPLQTVSNLLAAIREGDYSIRARGARHDDALGEVILELNNLGAPLRAERLGALEATALLSKVMLEIDVAVFTFDHHLKLRLVNRAGERLLAQPSERLLERTAAELGLAHFLEGEPSRTLQAAFPGGLGRWGMRRGSFREDGLPHQLLVLTDLSRTLREEERQAWQRLLRVLGHEINNSLAPIKSIAGSLENLISKESKQPDWKEDMQRGLNIIATRAESLNRFMEAYTRVARLPQPTLRPLAVQDWVRRIAGLETRLSVAVRHGPDQTIRADGDQLDQLLINLVRNAVDASLETGGSVAISWSSQAQFIEVRIEDEGPGLSSTANLFVPFFTTKPKGSGIGLVLCRQIAEAHGGNLTLENRADGKGCIAKLQLPINPGRNS